MNNIVVENEAIQNMMRTSFALPSLTLKQMADEKMTRASGLVTVYLKVLDAQLRETDGRTTWLQLYGEQIDEASLTIRMWSTEWKDVGRMLDLDVNDRAGKHIVEAKLANYKDRYVVICNAEMEFPGYYHETTGKWTEEEGQAPKTIACRPPMTTVRPVTAVEWKEACVLNARLHPDL